MADAKTAASGQRGATVLMAAAGLVPLLFFLLSFSLDAARYMLETQKYQKALDDVALYAYRFLPFQEEARRAAQLYISRFPNLASGTEVEITPDVIELRYTGDATATFAGYFGVDTRIPLSAFTRVRGTPFDAIVFLDVGSYMAPELAASAAWGGDSDWPAASLFETGSSGIGGSAIDSRILTQQCFNPAFSSLKRAAIATYEYLSQFQLNGVGAAVFPGSADSVGILRSVTGRTERRIGAGEADFDNYVGQHNRNALCAAVAEHEFQYPMYQFGSPDTRFVSDPAPAEPSNVTLFDRHQSSWYLNPEFLPFIRVRHALWSQAKREGQAGDFSQVVRRIREQLVGAHFTGERGGLVESPMKSAFIFSGDVPHASGGRFPETSAVEAIEEQLSALRNDALNAGGVRLQVYYVLFRHEGNATQDFLQRVDTLADFLAGQSTQHVRIHFLYAENSDEFRQFAPEALMQSSRTAVLSR